MKNKVKIEFVKITALPGARFVTVASLLVTMCSSSSWFFFVGIVCVSIECSRE